MARFLLGILWRQVLFWSIALGLMVPLELAILAESDRPATDAWAVARASLFLATVVSVSIEWLLLVLYLRGARRFLEAKAQMPPGRPEGVLTRRRPLIGLFVAWIVALEVRELWANGALHPMVVPAALVWTLVTVGVLSLVVGRFTLWRHRRAVRRHGQDGAADLMPLLVVTWSAPMLALAFVRLPNATLLRFILALLVAWAESATKPSSGPTVEVLVELGPDDRIEEVQTLLAWHGAVAERTFPGVSPWADEDLGATWTVKVATADAPSLMVSLLMDPENVDWIELNALTTPEHAVAAGSCEPGRAWVPVNDPLASGQHELVEIGAVEALLAARLPWRRVKLAVIDTGVDSAHEDLRGAIWLGPRDAIGHGTNVAGIAAAVADNGHGIATLNRGGRHVELLAYPVFASAAVGQAEVADAIVAATDDGASVIVLAFSAHGPAPRAVTHAVEYARRHDVLVVTSAGNEGERGRDASEVWPANIHGVVVVGAAEAGRRAPWSNTARWASYAVAAPGTGVCAPRAGGGYERVSGTSISAPMVAGVAAVYRSMCPAVSADRVAKALVATGGPHVPGLGPTLQADRLLADGCGD